MDEVNALVSQQAARLPTPSISDSPISLVTKYQATSVSGCIVRRGSEARPICSMRNHESNITV